MRPFILVDAVGPQASRSLLFALGLALTLTAVGGRAAERPADGANPTLRLPPLIVEAKTKTRPWRYAAQPGCEILSRCTDAMTREFITAHQRTEQLLHQLLPPELRMNASAPHTYILLPLSETPTTTTEVLAQFDRAQRNTGAAPTIDTLRNLSLNDLDTGATLVVVDERRFEPETLIFSPERIALVLERRTPPLPRWFVDGFAGWWGELRLAETGPVVRPLTWVSAEKTQVLKSDPAAPRRFLSLSDLMTLPRGAWDSLAPETAALARAQAKLLIRWALDSEEVARREGWWKLVARTVREPATDALVRDCLGLGFADLRDRLSDSFPSVLTATRPVRLAPASASTKASLRDATLDEVGRLKGDWERLVSGYIKRRHADFLFAYETEAERTLLGTYARGARDPLFLAVLGLYHADRGHAAEARTFLEAAADGKVPRPRVYVELTRQRHLAARAHPLGSAGRFTALQANDILAPLAIAQELSPPLPEAFDLAGIVWLNTDAPIGPAQWALFERGRELFPDHVPLLFHLASLRVREGHRREAEQLLTQALALKPPPALQRALLELQKLLESGGRDPVAPN